MEVIQKVFAKFWSLNVRLFSTYQVQGPVGSAHAVRVHTFTPLHVVM